MLPPYAAFLGLRLGEDAAGAPLVILPPGDHLIGRPGFLHGGALGGLLEIAALVALHAAGAGDRRPKPITVTVDYMRGGHLHETHAQGRIIRLGARIANLEATAWQRDPTRPIAAARMNLLLAPRA